MASLARRALHALSVALVAAAAAHARHCPQTNVCFALDESTSLSSEDFQQQAASVALIADAFAVQSRAAGRSLFAAVGYASVPDIISDATNNRHVFKKALASNTQMGGGTAFAAGLDGCIRVLPPAPAPRVIVLLTDGPDSGHPSGRAAAAVLKRAGVKIVTVGLGIGVDQIELREIASHPNLFLHVFDFGALRSAVGAVSRRLCERSSPSTPPASTTSPTPTPSSSHTPTPTPSPSPRPRPNCALVDCARCGRVLECRVRSANAALDRWACRRVRRRRAFCAWAEATKCGQSCRCLPQGVRCFRARTLGWNCPSVRPGVSQCRFGGARVRDPVVDNDTWRVAARGWGFGRGRGFWAGFGTRFGPHAVDSFASYRICKTARRRRRRFSIQCVRKRCIRGRCKCLVPDRA